MPPPTASEAAFERLLARFDDAPDVPDAPADRAPKRETITHLSSQIVLANFEPSTASSEAGRDVEPANADAAFLRQLFEKKNEYLERDRYASIGDADDFYSKIVGVSFEGRQNVVAALKPGDPLDLVREPGNAFDSNALAVRFGTLQLGFIRREIARRIAPNIDAGDRYVATVGSITGGGVRNVGVNIRVRRIRLPPLGGRTEITERETVSSDALRVALIGQRPLRTAQQAVLSRVASGRNTLAILGTGRGKSLCFQLPAAERALFEGRKTLVFYPLRALANDQYDALTRRFAAFGLRVLRANGSIDGGERAELEAALDDGSWDVILSTPEFATYHRDAFVRPSNRPSLVVVDEAHHVYESRHRPAYSALATFVTDLGAPQVLALTATANDHAFREICRALAIESWVIDPTVRENLHVIDARNETDKNAYLARELDGDGKAIVYCNSRAEVTKLADRLRARFGPSVAFYHAGVPAPERVGVEDLFRRGAIRIIVATSAFGEGIDLPDVRDVVLYHLNFDFTEFNQMAGRAGRDGDDARIHLLYGDGDRRINDYIIARNAPSLEMLRELYRGMRGLASGELLRMNYEDIARTLTIDNADGSTVTSATHIFAEGGLVETGTDDDGRFIRFMTVAGRIDLTETPRYAEGQAERESFDRFCGLALSADAPTLEQIVNRPIYPDRVPLEN